MPYGVFICLSCAGIHRSLGVHLSFVRSTTLDTWTEDQLALMSVGGNQRARSFFKQHGWDELGSDKIEAKYTSRAAQMYRKQLEKEAQKLIGGDNAVSTKSLESTKSSSLNKSSQRNGVEKAENASATPASSKPSATLTKATNTTTNRPAATTKARLGARKLGARTGGGLGVKKIANNIDDSLFDQAPEEKKSEVSDVAEAKDFEDFEDPLPVPTSSRFAMDTLEEKMRPARGKDGHLTLDTSSDFFSDPIGHKSSGLGVQDSIEAVKTNGTPGAGAVFSGSIRQTSRTKLSQEQEVGTAQARFGDAKSISSSAFFDDQQQDNGYERSVKLSQFQGSTAISSDAYFGRESRSGKMDTLDASAADMIGRIGLTARQDVEQLKVMASEATSKLGRMASSFIRDLQGGY